MSVDGEGEFVKDLKKKLRSKLRCRYSQLNKALRGSMESFAGEMFSAGLIGEENWSSRNFRDIFNEFLAGLDIKNSVKELRDHYEKLLEVLSDLGGSAGMVASRLTTDWASYYDSSSQSKCQLTAVLSLISVLRLTAGKTCRC